MEFFTEKDCDVNGRDAMHVKSISIEKANRLLRERGTVVECYKLKESNLTDEHGPGWTAAEPSTRITRPESTHTALLINIQPIEQEKDTVEKVLRELVDHYSVWKLSDVESDIIDRAKKLLDKL